MTHAGLVVGHREFPPERTKLIVITDAPTNPLRRLGEKRIAIRQYEDIVWVREMQAVITYIHGGRVLKQESLHSDYYGFMTAANDLIEDDLPILQRAFEVSADSSLEITVRLALEDTPTLGYVETEWSKRKYQAIGGGVFVAGDISDETDFFAISWEEKIALQPIIHSVADVWSTKRTDKENAKALAAYKRMALSGKRVLGVICTIDSDVLGQTS